MVSSVNVSSAYCVDLMKYLLTFSRYDNLSFNETEHITIRNVSFTF